MKVDANSDTAFLLIMNMFLMMFGGVWAMANIVAIWKFGLRDKEKRVRKHIIGSIILCILLWVAIYYLTSYLQENEWLQNFDPYQVLNISSDATLKEIKKAYRSLSLQWHPDKNRDPDAKKMFYLINKANDILTDPKKKDNWLKYGNPDGPVGFSMSIALPSFLFNPKY